MDRLGHQFLAGAGLAEDEHRAAGGGDLFDHRLDPLHGRTDAEGAVRFIVQAGLGAEHDVLLFQLLPQRADFPDLLAQPVFHFLAGGDVRGHAGEEGPGGVLVLADTAAGDQPAVPAVGIADPVLDLHLHPEAARSLDVFGDQVVVLGIDMGEDVVQGNRLLLAELVMGEGDRGRPEHPRLQVEFPQADTGRSRGHVQPFLVDGMGLEHVSTFDGADEDLAEQVQLGDQGQGQENRFPGGVDHQDVVHPAVEADGDGQGGLDAEPDKGGAVQGCFRGHGIDPGLDEGAALEDELFIGPGCLFGQVDPFQQQFRAGRVPGV